MNVWTWVVIVCVGIICFIIASVLGLDYWVEKSLRDLRKQKPTAVLGEGTVAGNDGIPLAGEERRRRAQSMAHGQLNPDDPRTPKRP